MTAVGRGVSRSNSTARRRLRLTLLTLGSRGDVEPYLGLGVALRHAGHEVTVAAPAAFRGFVRRTGLKAHIVAPDPRLLPADGGPPRWLRPSAAAGVMRLRQGSRVLSGLGRAYSGYLEASRDADVILHPPWLTPVARTIAEARGSLAMPAFLAPVHPTRAFPSPFLNLSSHPDWNPWSHSLALWLGRAALNGAPNQWRSHVVGLAPTEVELLPPDDEVTLYGFSRNLLPPPPDWPPGAVVTGPWWLETPGDWRPPDAVDRFLRGPGKVVLIGFGSMMDDRPGSLNAIVESTLARLGVRAVLLAGPGGQLALPPSPRHIVVRDLPFDWLFPRVDAIVHHGGAGTTAQSARSGKPAIAVPFFGDQLFWGQRLHRAGGGPPPIPRRALTAERLATALESALYDPTHAEQAERLATQVRAERGLTTAVSLVEARVDGFRGKLPVGSIVGLDQAGPRYGPRSSDR